MQGQAGSVNLGTHREVEDGLGQDAVFLFLVENNRLPQGAEFSIREPAAVEDSDRLDAARTRAGRLLPGFARAVRAGFAHQLKVSFASSRGDNAPRRRLSY